MQWSPSVVHPQLAAGQRVALRTEDAQPAPVVDRGGAALLTATPVVTVLLDRQAAGNLTTVAGALATALGPIDPEITQASITNGATKTPDGQGYTVAVLRQADYLRVKNAIHELPGVRFTSASGSSPRTPGSRARCCPPSVGRPRRSWTARRAGRCSRSTARATRSRRSSRRRRGRARPSPPASTCAIQTAAEDAVEPVAQPTVLVAVAPSTGDILAVAQNGPADAAGAISLTGRYPPGSTFKMVTATAAVEGLHLTVDSPEACPGVTVIGGRPVPNEGEFDLGTVPLRTAFAKSCNTTFAQLGAQLPPDALRAPPCGWGWAPTTACRGSRRSPARCRPRPTRCSGPRTGSARGR